MTKLYVVIIALSLTLPFQGDVAAKTSPSKNRNLNLSKSRLFHFANPKLKSYWVTLHPNTPIVGVSLPHYKDDLYTQHEINSVSQLYVKNIFGLIVQNAHQLAMENIVKEGVFKDRRQYNAYWGFMLASLALFHHESKLSHIRTVKGKHCVQKANQFEKNGFQKVSYSVKNVMNHFYKDPYETLVPHCKDLEKEKPTYQFLFNGRAIGISQLNARFHLDGVAPDVLLDFNKSIQKGLNYFLLGSGTSSSQGYMKILKNYKRFVNQCYLMDPSEPDHFKSKNIYYNLARATYISQYNQGNTTTKNICGFSQKWRKNNPESQFDQHYLDANSDFEEHTLKHFFNGRSIFHKTLPKDTLERKVFELILQQIQWIHGKNLKTGRSLKSGQQGSSPMNHKSLLELVHKHYTWVEAPPTEKSTYRDPKIHHNSTFPNFTHITSSFEIPVYARKSNTSQYLCGKIIDSKKNHLPIKVLSQQDTNAVVDFNMEHLNWSKIELPRYFPYFKKNNEVQYIALKSGVQYTNIRHSAKFKEKNENNESINTKTGQVLKLNTQLTQLKYLDQIGPWYKVLIPNELENLSGFENLSTDTVHQQSFKIAYVHNSTTQPIFVEETNHLNPECENTNEYFVTSDNLSSIPDPFKSSYLYIGRIDTSHSTVPKLMKTWIKLRPNTKNDSYNKTSIRGLLYNNSLVYVIGKTKRFLQVWYPAYPYCFKHLSQKSIPSKCTGWIHKNYVKKLDEVEVDKILLD